MSTVDSLLRQSFENFELVVADDASAGETKAYLEELPSQDSRVRVCRTELPVLSDPIALAGALQRANPERPFLTFLSPDCLLLPNALKSLIEHLESKPTADFSFGSLLTVGTKDEASRSRADTAEMPLLHQTRCVGVLLRKVFLGRTGWLDGAAFFRRAADADFLGRMTAVGRSIRVHRDTAQFFKPFSAPQEIPEMKEIFQILEKYRTYRDSVRWLLTPESVLNQSPDRIPAGDWLPTELTTLFSALVEYFLERGELKKVIEWTERLEQKIDRFPSTRIAEPHLRAGLVLGLAKNQRSEARLRVSNQKLSALTRELEVERSRSVCSPEEFQLLQATLSASEELLGRKTAEADALAKEVHMHRVELAALRHRVVDQINVLLKRPPLLHRALKFAAHRTRRIAGGIRSSIRSNAETS